MKIDIIVQLNGTFSYLMITNLENESTKLNFMGLDASGDKVFKSISDKLKDYRKMQIISKEDNVYNWIKSNIKSYNIRQMRYIWSPRTVELFSECMKTHKLSIDAIFISIPLKDMPIVISIINNLDSITKFITFKFKEIIHDSDNEVISLLNKKQMIEFVEINKNTMTIKTRIIK